MKTRILTLIATLLLLYFGGLNSAFGLDNVTPPPPPPSDIDGWDDDVWADWGSPATTKGGAPQAQEKQQEKTGPIDDLNTGPALNQSVGDGFGKSNANNPVKFRLVREGYSDSLEGPRKFRPKYRNNRKSL